MCSDSFGLVRFNHVASVQHGLMKWKNVSILMYLVG